MVLTKLMLLVCIVLHVSNLKKENFLLRVAVTQEFC
jgi:hypothetical protein